MIFLYLNYNSILMIQMQMKFNEIHILTQISALSKTSNDGFINLSLHYYKMQSGKLRKGYRIWAS